MWLDLSSWEKDIEIFVSHVKTHQKVISTEGDITRNENTVGLLDVTPKFHALRSMN